GFYEPSNEPFAARVVDRVDNLGRLHRLPEEGPVSTAPPLGAEGRVHHHRRNPSEGDGGHVSSDEMDFDAEAAGVLSRDPEGRGVHLYADDGPRPQEGGTDRQDPGSASQVADGPLQITPEEGGVEELRGDGRRGLVLF